MMKKLNLFKVTVVGLMIGLTAMMGFSASVSISPSAAATNSLLAIPGQITRLTFTAGGTAAAIRLQDAPSTTQTFVIGAYTNYAPSVYTNTATYTDILGNTVSNSYKYITNIATAVIQTTNNYRTVGVYAVPANETVTIAYDTANPFVFGLLATNSVACTITVDYLPWK
jgi:hypothetical protein